MNAESVEILYGYAHFVKIIFVSALNIIMASHAFHST